MARCSDDPIFLRWKMEVHVVPGGDWRSIKRGWLVVPSAKSGLDLFVDTLANPLPNFGFDDIALRVNGHLDDDIALQVSGELGARHGRIWKHDRIRDVDFMAGDRSVNHGAQRRPGVRIVVAGLLVRREPPRGALRRARVGVGAAGGGKTNLAASGGAASFPPCGK